MKRKKLSESIREIPKELLKSLPSLIIKEFRLGDPNRRFLEAKKPKHIKSKLKYYLLFQDKPYGSPITEQDLIDVINGARNNKPNGWKI